MERLCSNEWVLWPHNWVELIFWLVRQSSTFESMLKTTDGSMNAKHLFTAWLILLLILGSSLSHEIQAQHRAVRFRLHAQKTIKLDKKWRLSAQETIQVSPEFSRLLDRGVRDPEFDEIDFDDPTFLLRTVGDEDLIEEDDESEEEYDDSGDLDGDQSNEDDKDGSGDDQDDGDDNDDDDDDDDGENDPTNGMYVPGWDLNNTAAPDETTSRDWLMEDLNFRSLTTLEIRYRLSRRFKLSSGYSYTLRPGTDSHRLHLDLRSDHPFANIFRWSNRLRWQSSAAFDEGFNASHFARLRSRIKVSWDKIVPYADVELLYRVRGERSAFRSFRIGSGMSLKVLENQKLRFAYLYQQRFNSTRHSHTFNLEYRFTFSSK